MTAPTLAQASIMGIKPYKGGNTAAAGMDEFINLAANENPFGVPPAAQKAIAAHAAHAHRYPDGGCTALREALGKKHNINPDQIVCGAGSDELIAFLCQAYAGAGDEVLYSEHGFLMYPISAQRVGAVPVKAAEEDLKTSVKNLLAAVTPKTKILFVANPNNPTGSYLTTAELTELRSKLPAHILLVIDAAYAEYATGAAYESGQSLVAATKNTVMLRTFSKLYGLASLRLGWAYAPPELTDVLNRVRGPFNVSQVAQDAGLAALGDDAFVAKSIAHNTRARKTLSDGIAALGLKVYPSEGNFILVELPKEEGHNSATLDAFVKSKGMIIRRMESYGLGHCLRITIGSDDENAKLLSYIKVFLAQ